MADPQTRKLARQLVGFEERLKSLETVPQLAHSSIDDHGLPVYDKDGNLVSRVGKQADGTWGAPPLAGPVPSPPMGVSAVGGAGIVHVTWTGDFEQGAAPLDFDALEVLIDGALMGAISDRDGGSTTIPAEQGHRYVAARIRTLVPRHSSTTSPFSVEVRAPAEAMFDEANERLEDAEDNLAQARVELEEAAENVAETRERLTTLEEDTLPAAVEALEEADRQASAKLTDALQRLREAETEAEAARGRLKSAEQSLGQLDTRVDDAETRVAVTERQTQRGPVPQPGSPLGAQWYHPNGHLYVRVPCDEVEVA